MAGHGQGKEGRKRRRAVSRKGRKGHRGARVRTRASERQGLEERMLGQGRKGMMGGKAMARGRGHEGTNMTGQWNDKDKGK